DGLALISHVAGALPGPGVLTMTHCNDVACSAATSTVVAPAIGVGTSTVIGSDGLGLVGYGDFAGLHVAHCLDAACSTATSALVHGGPVLAASIAVATDGRGVIAFGE